MVLIHAEPRPFTRDEFYRMGDMGLFVNEHVELIEGKVLRKPVMNIPHDRSITRATVTLVRAFADRWMVRCQLQLDLGTYNQPEPDFTLVTKQELNTCPRHPQKADLVIEVSDSSLKFDRYEKALVYAQAGIAEYWILNLVDNRLEIHRQPRRRAKRVPYASITYSAPEDKVSPLCAPEVSIQVRDLM